MNESCRCAVEDLEPVMDSEYRGALRCPGCGSLYYMEDLPTEARFVAWFEAKRRRGIRHVHPPRRSGRRDARLVPDPALSVR
jgi:hypothetical protein